MAERILVYGAGVIGSIYAMRFARAGFEVTVVARGDRLEAIRARGLRTRHVLLEEEERVEVRSVEAIDPAETWELALVTVRADQIAFALRDLAVSTCTGPVVVIGNNFEGHQEQAAFIGASRYLLGFGSFGGYHDRGGIAYLDGRTRVRRGAGRRRRTMLGVLTAEAEGAFEGAKARFMRAGLPVRRSRDPVAWLRCHAALVLPLAAAIYAVGGGQERTCRTRDALVLGVRALHELMTALHALRVRTEPRSVGLLLALPEGIVVPLLGRTLAGEGARVAVFGHAEAPSGRGELVGLATALDAFVRGSGVPLESWHRLLLHVAPESTVIPIVDGSRVLRLQVW